MPRSLYQLQSLKARRRPLSPGMTLVELLVVMLISMIVLMAAVTVYKTGVTYYLKTDSMLTRNQDLRIALYNISRDVRMAGNGLNLMGPQVMKVQAWVPGRETEAGGPEGDNTPGWFRHADITGAAPEELGMRAIFGVDGGDEGPDTLTIFRAEVEYGVPLGQLGKYTGGRIDLRENFAANSLRPGDIVALVDGAQAALLEVDDGGSLDPDGFLRAASNFSVKLGGRYTPPSDGDFEDIGLNLASATGANIYNLRNVSLVTYYVDQPNRRLMADYHDAAVLDPESGNPAPVVVADDIEDFQVYYYYATDRGAQLQLAAASTEQNPPISSSALNSANNRVRAVALGLVAASDRETAADGDSEPAVRPALFNRKAGTEADRRPRQTMIELVSLRNF